MDDSTLALNRRASFDYEFLETIEGGLALTGPEVKSAKAGHIQLTGAFLFVQKGELWLKGARIAPYQPAGIRNGEPTRDRKVLVKKKDVLRFGGKTHADGLTLVPISVYVTRGLVKLKFALARGKKQYEKRDKIKKRDAAREDREYA